MHSLYIGHRGVQARVSLHTPAPRKLYVKLLACQKYMTSECIEYQHVPGLRLMQHPGGMELHMA